MQGKISWVDYYLGLAFIVAQKSPDTSTKHGCIITNSLNQPLGFGFNGFPRKAKDDEYLKENYNVRPIKYQWFYHSEENAIANCIIKPSKAIAYVTGQCCNHCLYSLWQNGIETVYMADRHGSYIIKQEDLDWQNEFAEQTGIKIYKVKPNLKFILDLPVEIFDATPLGAFKYYEESSCQQTNANAINVLSS